MERRPPSLATFLYLTAQAALARGTGTSHTELGDPSPTTFHELGPRADFTHKRRKVDDIMNAPTSTSARRPPQLTTMTTTTATRAIAAAMRKHDFLNTDHPYTGAHTVHQVTRHP
jgi:hypothetical protein